MAVLAPLPRADREAIRVQFFREYRGDDGCTSVAVRTNKAKGETYLSVGVSGDGARLPAEYDGLPVYTYKAAPAVHAVQYRTD